MRHLLALFFSAACWILGAAAFGSELFVYSDPSGLSAEAEFTLVSPTVLQVRYKNTSTGVPNGFNNADQILSGVSWDFGLPGPNSDTYIVGGSVRTGPASSSLNFSVQSVGPNEDVSGEFGFGNNDGTGALQNFISSNAAQGIPFGGANLDGPTNLDGPQGGLVANPAIVALGGLGAIQNEVVATLLLDGPALSDLGFLFANGVRFEFGSDAAFGTGIPFNPVPEPSALLLAVMGVAGLAACGRRVRGLAAQAG